ncbi:MAG: lipid-A-disaccharide synthase [Proteobacteria bacterium]|nr:lipid-A-disaccharide synthase [Pseudomonadota bacterium]
MPLIYLIAGEQSGDILGSRLMQAIRARRADVTFAGVGGAAMQTQGLRSLFEMRELSLMGLVEVLPRLRRIRSLLRQTVADIRTRRPDVLVTIDSPGFTLRVLKATGAQGPRRIHYVAPQVWAWREGRVKHYPGLWDDLLCLLPFEVPFFARHHLPARFVGHPVLESGAEAGDAARFRRRHAIGDQARVVTIMPGSRQSEVSRLLPVLEATLARIDEPLVPVLPLAGPVEDIVRRKTGQWPIPPILISDSAEKFDAFAASAAALTKSGTSTLELAMAGVPMLVTYQVNPISAWVGRRVIKVKYASIVNLVLDRPVVPELLQEHGKPEQLAVELRRLLHDPAAVAAQRAGFAEALALLRPPMGTPSDCAAAAVLEMLG